MTVRMSAVVAVILGVTVLAPAGRGDEKAANARARLEAARKTYEVIVARYGMDPNARLGVEDLYRWSRRWMEAERDLAEKPEDRVAAAQAHLDRMRKWEDRAKMAQKGGLVSPEEVSAAEFYRLEAEQWLAEAKGK